MSFWLWNVHRDIVRGSKWHRTAQWMDVTLRARATGAFSCHFRQHMFNNNDDNCCSAQFCVRTVRTGRLCSMPCSAAFVNIVSLHYLAFGYLCCSSPPFTYTRKNRLTFYVFSIRTQFRGFVRLLYRWHNWWTPDRGDVFRSVNETRDMCCGPKCMPCVENECPQRKHCEKSTLCRSRSQHTAFTNVGADDSSKLGVIGN